MEQLIMFLKLMTFFSADDFHFNLGFFIKLIRLKLTHRRLSKRNYIVYFTDVAIFNLSQGFIQVFAYCHFRGPK